VTKLVPLDNIDNESVPSASATINANNAKLATALANTLSRDGSAPNQMGAHFDLNGYRILNAPFPTNDTDVVRRVDLATLSIPGPKGDPGPTGSGTGDVLASNNGSDFTNAATFRTNLGLVYDVNVVAYRAVLEDIGDLSWPNNSLLWKNGSGNIAAFAVSSDVASFLGGANNSALRTSLGLGAVATLNIGTAAGTVAAGDDTRFSRFTITDVNSDSNAELTWAGRLIRHTSASAHAFTIQPVATIAHPVGVVIAVRNGAAGGVITLTRGSGVELRIAGATTNKNVTVAPGGYCTLVQEATNVWIAVGTGLA
jgi:hypothetical protein